MNDINYTKLYTVKNNFKLPYDTTKIGVKQVNLMDYDYNSVLNSYFSLINSSGTFFSNDDLLTFETKKVDKTCLPVSLICEIPNLKNNNTYLFDYIDVFNKLNKDYPYLNIFQQLAKSDDFTLFNEQTRDEIDKKRFGALYNYNANDKTIYLKNINNFILEVINPNSTQESMTNLFNNVFLTQNGKINSYAQSTGLIEHVINEYFNNGFNILDYAPNCKKGDTIPLFSSNPDLNKDIKDDDERGMIEKLQSKSDDIYFDGRSSNIVGKQYLDRYNENIWFDPFINTSGNDAVVSLSSGGMSFTNSLIENNVTDESGKYFQTNTIIKNRFVSNIDDTNSVLNRNKVERLNELGVFDKMVKNREYNQQSIQNNYANEYKINLIPIGRMSINEDKYIFVRRKKQNNFIQQGSVEYDNPNYNKKDSRSKKRLTKTPQYESRTIYGIQMVKQNSKSTTPVIISQFNTYGYSLNENLMNKAHDYDTDNPEYNVDNDEYYHNVSTRSDCDDNKESLNQAYIFDKHAVTFQALDSNGKLTGKKYDTIRFVAQNGTIGNDIKSIGMTELSKINNFHTTFKTGTYTPKGLTFNNDNYKFGDCTKYKVELGYDFKYSYIDNSNNRLQIIMESFIKQNNPNFFIYKKSDGTYWCKYNPSSQPFYRTLGNIMVGQTVNDEDYYSSNSNDQFKKFVAGNYITVNSDFIVYDERISKTFIDHFNKIKSSLTVCVANEIRQYIKSNPEILICYKISDLLNKIVENGQKDNKIVLNNDWIYYNFECPIGPMILNSKFPIQINNNEEVHTIIASGPLMNIIETSCGYNKVIYSNTSTEENNKFDSTYSKILNSFNGYSQIDSVVVPAIMIKNVSSLTEFISNPDIQVTSVKINNVQENLPNGDYTTLVFGIPALEELANCEGASTEYSKAVANSGKFTIGQKNINLSYILVKYDSKKCVFNLEYSTINSSTGVKLYTITNQNSAINSLNIDVSNDKYIKIEMSPLTTYDKTAAKGLLPKWNSSVQPL